MSLVSLSKRAAFAMLLVMLVVVPTALQFTDVEDAGAAPGDHLWSKRFGGAVTDVGYSVAVDGSGNTFLTGYFYGSVDFGGGPLTSAGSYDIFLAKFDAAGNHLWSKRFGDANSQQGYSVAVDGSGNAFLSGYFRGSVDFGGGPLTSAPIGDDVFLAKFDAAGNHLWSKRFGDANYQGGTSVAVDGSGNAFLTGYLLGSVDFGGGPLTSAGSYDIFLAKFDAAGNHLWSKRFGDAGTDVGYSVAVDGSGNAFLSGYFWGSVDFGGGPLTSAGSGDIFLAKLDGAGNHVWSKRFGDTGTDVGYSVAVDGSGNAFLTGYFRYLVDFGGGPFTSYDGSSNIFLAKFDTAGNHLWSKSFGDADDQVGTSVAVDGSGNAFLTGYLYGSVDFGGGPLTSAGSGDIFLAKFDAAGNHLWSKRFGDADYQIGRSVAVDGAGNAFLTGQFAGSVDFGGGPLTSAGQADIFLAKFAAAASVGGIAEPPDVASLPPAASIASRRHQATYELAGLVSVLAAVALGAGAVARRRRGRPTNDATNRR